MPCEYIISKGAKKGMPCGAGSDSLCARHRKITAKSTANTERRREAMDTLPNNDFDSDNIPIEPTVRTSDFAITINSQKDIEKMTDEQLEIFKGINNWLYDNEGIMEYIEFIGDNRILSKFCSFNYEVGEQQGRLHTHGIVQVKHIGKVRINIPALREWINDCMGEKVHLNIQVIKSGGTVGDWINYLNKRNGIRII